MAKKPKNKNATATRTDVNANVNQLDTTAIVEKFVAVQGPKVGDTVVPEPAAEQQDFVDMSKADSAVLGGSFGSSTKPADIAGAFQQALETTKDMDSAPAVSPDTVAGGPGYVPDFDYVGGSQVGNVLKQLEETAHTGGVDDNVLKDAVNEPVLIGVRQLGEILNAETGLRAGTMLSIAYDTAMWNRDELEAKVLDLFADTSKVDVYHRNPSLPRNEFVELRNNAKVLNRVSVVFVGYSTFAFCQRPAHFPLDSEVDCALVVRHGTIQCTKLRGVFDYNKELVAF
jgi:hypothetical protein